MTRFTILALCATVLLACTLPCQAEVSADEVRPPASHDAVPPTRKHQSPTLKQKLPEEDDAAPSNTEPAKPVPAQKPPPADETPADETPADEAPAEQEASEEGSSLLIWVVLLAVLGGMGAYFMSGKKRARPESILVMGPSLSGKTSLFYKLKDGGVLTGTTVSMKENQASFPLRSFGDGSPLGTLDPEAPPVHMIDYPGEPQLSSRLPDFFPLSKAILFVVNAADKASIELHAAEQMYQLLTHPVIAENAPPVLVLCNQSDFPLAAKCALVQKLFEEELTKLSRTRAVDVDQDDTESESVPLGVEGVDFSFAEHSPCEVRFLKCSATTGEGLQAVVDFCLDES